MIRENANLKSQLESLENTIRGLKLNVRTEKTETQTLEKQGIDAKEHKAQDRDHIELKLKQYNQDLIKVKDDNIHLQTELMKYR